MKVRPLIIDDEIRESIAALVANAEMNILSMDDLLDTYNKQKKPVGDSGWFVLNLPFGYRIVYSIENQPTGLVRHLSMSVNENEKLPSIDAVSEIMKLIGFKHKLNAPTKVLVKLEDISPKRQAINVWEKITK